MRYWNRVKDVLRYRKGTPNLSIFYKKNQNLSLISYVDAGYLSDSHNSKSQIDFVFLHGRTIIL
jgi:hypothetical protein